MSEKKLLTVGELRALLAEVPDDAIVWSDGCDCAGEAGGVTYNPSDNTLMVDRSENKS